MKRFTLEPVTTEEVKNIYGDDNCLLHGHMSSDIVEFRLDGMYPHYNNYYVLVVGKGDYWDSIGLRIVYETKTKLFETKEERQKFNSDNDSRLQVNLRNLFCPKETCMRKIVKEVLHSDKDGSIAPSTKKILERYLEGHHDAYVICHRVVAMINSLNFFRDGDLQKNRNRVTVEGDKRITLTDPSGFEDCDFRSDLYTVLTLSDNENSYTYNFFFSAEDEEKLSKVDWNNHNAITEFMRTGTYIPPSRYRKWKKDEENTIVASLKPFYVQTTIGLTDDDLEETVAVF